ncbi:MAG TPA: hypothetical protein DCP24_12675 [Nitrospiraceae bacterium]|nr:hypothetical protein [Nitrospiraceae bacterium]
MRSYEAIQRAINGKTIEHAKALGISSSLVTKWQEPHLDFTDSGSYNPLDRIESIIEKSLSLGNPPERAYAPIKYLEERFGIIGIALPEQLPGMNEISHELLETVREFGQLAEAASKALRDGRITKPEYAKIKKEGWDLIRQVAEFLHKASEAVR